MQTTPASVAPLASVCIDIGKYVFHLVGFDLKGKIGQRDASFLRPASSSLLQSGESLISSPYSPRLSNAARLRMAAFTSSLCSPTAAAIAFSMRRVSCS